MKTHRISTLAALAPLEAAISRSAETTLHQLQARLACQRDLNGFAALRFDPIGCDPLDASRSLNLVEQLNQSFTYLASILATRWLLERHPAHAPYTLNLGTTAGSDIVSDDGAVAAETFAATHPGSNQKLQKDVAKVRRVSATHRYVFYLSPLGAPATEVAGVTVVRLEHACLTTARSAGA